MCVCACSLYAPQLCTFLCFFSLLFFFSSFGFLPPCLFWETHGSSSSSSRASSSESSPSWFARFPCYLSEQMSAPLKIRMAKHLVCISIGNKRNQLNPSFKWGGGNPNFLLKRGFHSNQGPRRGVANGGVRWERAQRGQTGWAREPAALPAESLSAGRRFLRSAHTQHKCSLLHLLHIFAQEWPRLRHILKHTGFFFLFIIVHLVNFRLITGWQLFYFEKSFFFLSEFVCLILKRCLQWEQPLKKYMNVLIQK